MTMPNWSWASAAASSSRSRARQPRVAADLRGGAGASPACLLESRRQPLPGPRPALRRQPAAGPGRTRRSRQAAVRATAGAVADTRPGPTGELAGQRPDQRPGDRPPGRRPAPRQPGQRAPAAAPAAPPATGQPRRLPRPPCRPSATGSRPGAAGRSFGGALPQPVPRRDRTDAHGLRAQPTPAPGPRTVAGEQPGGGRDRRPGRLRSQSAFTAALVREFGVTPRQLRRESRDKTG